jgi:mycofactocin biosynthesis protein MftB
VRRLLNTVAPVEADGLLDRSLVLTPQVSVRPEAFGALLYHFGTRRLSFLKDPRLLVVLEHLDDAATARDACVAAGVGAEDLAGFERALARLVATDMVRARP